MKEVTYTCDRCGKTSNSLDGWYELHYHALRPHHHMIPQFDESGHWQFCSWKCLTKSYPRGSLGKVKK